MKNDAVHAAPIPETRFDRGATRPWYACGRMRVGVAWLIGCAAWGAGCGGDTIFQCQNDEQCVSSGVTGKCQPNGYCSFVDAGCETGFRYADSAPPGLAGQCVEPEDGSTSGPPVPTSTATAPSSSGPGSGTTGDSTSGSTTLETGGETGTVSSQGSSTESTGSGNSTSSTTGTSSSSGATVCPEFVDEFDNGVVQEAPWVQFSGRPPILSESDGRLQFSIAPGTEVFEFIEMADVDISEGFAAAHLVSLPQDDAAQFLLRAFPDDDPDGAVELLVTNATELVARVDGDLLQFVDLGPPADELWLEIFFSAGVASFSYSVDGVDYTFIGSSAVMGDYSVADVSLMGGAFEPTTAPLHVIEVEDFEFCTQPFE